MIRQELYPATQFPEIVFPDLCHILLELFNSQTGPNPDITKKSDHLIKTDEIQKTARELLNLENLIKNHPHTLIRIYYHMVKKFVAGKHRVINEREDIFQEIITRLLSDKISRIQKHYQFNRKKKPSFTSYFLVIVRNIYVDIFREKKMRVLNTIDHQEYLPQEPARSTVSPAHNLLFEEEYTKLDYIFKMYHRSRSRIELTLKIKNRIPVTAEDIRRCFPGSNEKSVSILSQDFRFKTDKDVFQIIAPLFNQYEQKKNRGDTLRKWISIKIDEIIAHMNHTHELAVYNNDNISDLFVLYYQKIQKSGEKGNENP